MKTFGIILTIADLLTCVVLTAVVLFQSGKSAGLSGAIAGAADSFMSKGKSKTLDTKLASATKWIAGLFVVLSLLLCIVVNASYPTAA